MGRYNYIIFKISLCAYVLAGCTTLNRAQSPYGLSYEQVESLTLNSKSEALIEKFGRPDHIVQDVSNAGSECWVYFVKGRKWTRAAFWINTSDKTLIGKTFEFMNENHSVLETVLSRLPNAKFRIERPKQIGHYIPRELNYSDDKLGIYLVVNEGRQEVESIRWVNPQGDLPLKTAETN